jgi:hypothetical protein
MSKSESESESKKMDEFIPNPKRIKQSVEETKIKYPDSGGYIVYDPSMCDVSKYPKIEKKEFQQVAEWGIGIDPEGTATYYYAVYDAIQKLDKAILLLEETQDCITMWDVRDGLWEESYNNLNQMRNDWVEHYENMRKRAIKEKSK